ncbi:MAG TPA: site-specific DNA-methyltransferase [Candidatus Binatia bacterium]|nr:site-specific DNA-methyltransferase [Candidatus Binatia bacterium]
MTGKKKNSGDAKEPKRPLEQYTHPDKQRVNNPPVGLVTPATDRETGKKTYAYDPHLDPQLQWAGKAEHVSFEVPTVSLHVHERIDPKAIIATVKKRNSTSGARKPGEQLGLFEAPQENPPLREAIEFYKHKHGWTNRLIAGDSMLVMNSLVEKEGMAGKVQMVYIDPPYGIKYGSNFQPFVNKRDVKDGKDEDLTQEPETIKAFRDTWELGIHSYLTYLRDRLLLARELLHESGSCFVQISDENVHLVRNLMDEVFGEKGFVSQISFKTKKMSLGRKYLATVNDSIIWYARDIDKVKYRQLFTTKDESEDSPFAFVELPDGVRRRMTKDERSDQQLLPDKSKIFRTLDLHSTGRTESCVFDFDFEGSVCSPKRGKSWKTNRDGIERLKTANRLIKVASNVEYVLYHNDFPVTELTNVWNDTQGASDKLYVVQTTEKAVQRCLLMSTDPGDLVFDPTCGSGTTAYIAEQWGRRWITCDTSRVSTTLAKQRLMTAVFDYYELAHPEEGVGSGFKYKTVPHLTLGSIANNPEIHEGTTREEIDRAVAKYANQETIYDQPTVDRKKVRITGPFTVEAVPAPVVTPIEEVGCVPRTEQNGAQGAPYEADVSIARSGETLRQAEWRDELLRTGIRGKGGQKIEFSRVEPLAGTRWLHADGETRPYPNPKGDGINKPQRVIISFGPEHALLEQRQVALALEEASQLFPKPAMVVFAYFEIDPEAAKDIDEINPMTLGMTLLKVKMNADLLTDDLKKKRASNESFWLVGSPDVELRKLSTKDVKAFNERHGTDHKTLHVVEVHGFDYFNTKTGELESGGSEKIALWMLDTDYDGRSLYPRQVFFPMSGEKDGWSKLARNLKAEIDEEMIGAYRGTVSLPFAVGEHGRVAVKIVDDRGIESLKIIALA